MRFTAFELGHITSYEFGQDAACQYHGHLAGGRSPFLRSAVVRVDRDGVSTTQSETRALYCCLPWSSIVDIQQSHAHGRADPDAEAAMMLRSFPEATTVTFSTSAGHLRIVMLRGESASSSFLKAIQLCASACTGNEDISQPILGPAAVTSPARFVDKPSRSQLRSPDQYDNKIAAMRAEADEMRREIRPEPRTRADFSSTPDDRRRRAASRRGESSRSTSAVATFEPLHELDSKKKFDSMLEDYRLKIAAGDALVLKIRRQLNDERFVREAESTMQFLSPETPRSVSRLVADAELLRDSALRRLDQVVDAQSIATTTSESQRSETVSKPPIAPENLPAVEPVVTKTVAETSSTPRADQPSSVPFSLRADQPSPSPQPMLVPGDGWIAKWNAETQRTFYFHAASKRTTWKHEETLEPVVAAVPLLRTKDCWKEQWHAPSSRIYYYNQLTKKTTWNVAETPFFEPSTNLDNAAQTATSAKLVSTSPEVAVAKPISVLASPESSTRTPSAIAIAPKPTAVPVVTVPVVTVVAPNAVDVRTDAAPKPVVMLSGVEVSTPVPPPTSATTTPTPTTTKTAAESVQVKLAEQQAVNEQSVAQVNEVAKSPETNVQSNAVKEAPIHSVKTKASDVLAEKLSVDGLPSAAQDSGQVGTPPADSSPKPGDSKDGWLCKVDPKSGKTYFKQTSSGTVQWKIQGTPWDRASTSSPPAVPVASSPGASVAASHSKEEAKHPVTEPEQRGVWIKKVDEKTGKTFYKNTDTKKTQWSAVGTTFDVNSTDSETPAADLVAQQPITIDGWRRSFHTAKNKFYYTNLATKEATYSIVGTPFEKL